jgi:hypothetical protein
MTFTREHLIENQRTVRSANERLSEIAHISDGKHVPFLCECADIDCLGRLEASLSEFVVIHEHRARYFILPGHLRVDREDVLSANDRFEVVEKQAH